jgi:acyl-coenzyme A synthetase/AMP-(fatty) acid ligase
MPIGKKVIVLTRTRTPVSMIKGRDVWWEDEIKKVETQGNPDCPAEEMDAEDMLFILYTSGSTGKPKGRGTYLRWLHGLHRLYFCQRIPIQPGRGIFLYC